MRHPDCFNMFNLTQTSLTESLFDLKMSKIGDTRLKLTTKILIKQLSQTHVLYIAAEISDTKEQVFKPEVWLSCRKNINSAWIKQKDQLLGTSGSIGKDVRYYEYMSHMSQTYGDVHENVIKEIITSKEMKIYDKKVSAILETLNKKISDPDIQAKLKPSNGSEKRLKLSFDLNFTDLENTSDDYLNNIMNNVRLEVIDVKMVKANKKKKKQKNIPSILHTVSLETNESMIDTNEQSDVLFSSTSDTSYQSDSEIIIPAPVSRMLKASTIDVIENICDQANSQIDTFDGKINNHIETDDPLREHRRFNYNDILKYANPCVDPCVLNENYYTDPYNRVYFVDPYTGDLYAVIDPYTREQYVAMYPHTGEQYIMD